MTNLAPQPENIEKQNETTFKHGVFSKESINQSRKYMAVEACWLAVDDTLAVCLSFPSGDSACGNKQREGNRQRPKARGCAIKSQEEMPVIDSLGIFNTQVGQECICWETAELPLPALVLPLGYHNTLLVSLLNSSIPGPKRRK